MQKAASNSSALMLCFPQLCSWLSFCKPSKNLVRDFKKHVRDLKEPCQGFEEEEKTCQGFEEDNNLVKDLLRI